MVIIGLPLAGYFFSGAAGLNLPEPLQPSEATTRVANRASPSPRRNPAATNERAEVANSSAFSCEHPTITDGDTLRCGATRVRLASIDAPELPGHCRIGRACTPGDPFASTENLRRLIGGRPIRCRQTDTDRYGRVVARCTVAEEDLSCAQVSGGYAVIRYGALDC